MNETSLPSSIKHDVEQTVSGGATGFLASLAERLGAGGGTAAVYGDPIERDGTTIIPVARTFWGVGGGNGRGRGAEGGGSGEGGGGGMAASPVGFIEIRNGESEFRPIHVRPPLWALAPVIMASGVASLLFLHGLRRLTRG